MEKEMTPLVPTGTKRAPRGWSRASLPAEVGPDLQVKCSDLGMCLYTDPCTPPGHKHARMPA